jgi:hypothetical protein
MSGKVSKTIAVVLLATLMLSCNKNPNKVIWGETNYYDKFLFKEYEPVIMTQALELEFNDEAQSLLTEYIVFEIVEIDEIDKFVVAKGIKVYKNGAQCANNLLSVKSGEKEIKLGIEFTGEAIEGNHTLYLRVKNGGGLDRIDNTDLSAGGDVILQHEWVVKKDDVMNPLAVIMIWGLVVIIGLLSLWRIVIRQLLNPHFEINKIEIIAPNFWKIPKIRGYYKVVFTNRTKTQSFFHKFFIGNILFITNDFFIEDIGLFPKNFGKTIEIRVNAKKYDIISPRTTKLNQLPIEITKGSSKATIKII